MLRSKALYNNYLSFDLSHTLSLFLSLFPSFSLSFSLFFTYLYGGLKTTLAVSFLPSLSFFPISKENSPVYIKFFCLAL